MRKIFLAALLLIPAFAHAQVVQHPVTCSPSVSCNPSTGPSNTGTGMPAWQAFGWLNTDIASLVAAVNSGGSGGNVVGSGSIISGHCVQWTAAFTVVDSGATCGSGGSSAAFSALTSSTNITAAMLVGTGASLGATGSGSITATSMPASGLTGTLQAAQFPALTGVITTSAGSLVTSYSSVTGSGANVLATSPVLVSPALGTPSALVLTNATGLPNTSVIGLGTFATANATTPPAIGATTPAAGSFSSLTDTGITGLTQCLHVSTTGLVSGTGSDCGSGGSTAFSGLTSGTNTAMAAVIGTGASLATSGSGTIAATSAPVAGISGLGAGVATFLATPSTANLAAAVTGETGTGALVFATSPTLVTPVLGTPASGTLTNATGLPLSTGVTGNLAVGNLNGGTGAASGTYWSGSGTWTPPGMDTCADASGSTTAYTCTSANGQATTAGKAFLFKPQTTNTASASLTVNGQFWTLKKQGNNLVAGDVIGGQWYEVVSDGTFWQVASRVGTDGSGGGLSPISTQTVLGNGSGSTAAPVALTLSGNLVATATGLATSQPINAQTGTTYTVLSTDAGKLLTFNNAGSIAVTLPVATSAGFTAGFSFDAQDLGNGTTTITPTTSTINGATTLVVAKNQGCTVTSDGTNYQVSACTAIAGGGGGSGTVNSGTAGQLAFYSGSGTAVSGAASATIAAGALSLGASGTAGSVAMGNATSGTVTLQPVTGALGSVTASLPANTGTVAELNLAQTWSAVQTFGTNISIGGVTATGATGTGANVFATSPTLITPILGTPTSVTLTNATGLPFSGLTTGSITSGTLTVGTGGTLTVSGTGVNNANQINGATVPVSVPLGSNSSGQLIATTVTVNPQTGTSYAIATTDARALVTLSNAAAVAVTLPVATTAGYTSGFYVALQNLGAGLVTVTPTTSTINGAATLTIPKNSGCTILSDGTNYQVAACTGSITTVNGNAVPAATDTVALLAATQALTNKTINGNTWTAGTGTLTISAGKTLTASNSLTFVGTDGTTMTFPGASDTVDTLGAIQTVSAAKTFSALLTANLGITVAGATTKLTAGTAAIAPLTFQSGTNLTTPAAGVAEYDGVVPYFTPSASSRGVLLTDAFEVLSSAYTLTSQTAAQKLLNSTTNGTITLPVGTFDFECQFSLTSMSATSGTFGFALGGTATFTQAWWSNAMMAATLATATTPQMTYNTAANTALTTAGTTAAGTATITGNIRVTVAGTVIPQVSLSVAAAAVVGANSQCRFKPIGAQAVVSVGNWN